MPRNKIVIAGGSGFIGRALAGHFANLPDWSVTVLTRSPAAKQNAAAGAVTGKAGIHYVQWDAATAGPWAAELDGAAAVVNLTGKSIVCRHTPDNRRAILQSRVESVNAVMNAVKQAKVPPRCVIQAGAIGFYGNSGDAICDENSPVGTGFMADTCRVWEQAFTTAPVSGVRQVILRVGLVLGRGGGLLEPLEKLTRFGLGGAAGNGKQWMSWVHINDIVAMMDWLVHGSDAQGVFNATAPNPVRNKDFMAAMRAVLHRPWSPPAPALVVRLGARLMGTEPDLALFGCRAIPRHLLDSGFTFAFPELEAALQNCLGK